MSAGDQTRMCFIGPGSDAKAAALIDVVFVHGLGGDYASTWAPDGAVDCWLDWLVEDIPGIAVWSIQYPAGATKWAAKGEGMALPERAAGLIQIMTYHGIGSRKVIFVCHSLGGLMIKQILRNSWDMAKPEWRVIVDATVGVAFLATPHAGSGLATIAKAMRLSRATRTTLALAANDPHLKELADWYRQNTPTLGIQTIAYSESRKMRRGIRLFTVVSATSADPGITGCIATSVDSDHISICKPIGRDAVVYQGIETFIRTQLARIADLGSASSLVSSVDMQPAASVPLTELMRRIREVEDMGVQGILRPLEVKNLRMAMLNQHYGIDEKYRPKE